MLGWHSALDRSSFSLQEAGRCPLGAGTAWRRMTLSPEQHSMSLSLKVMVAYFTFLKCSFPHHLLIHLQLSICLFFQFLYCYPSFLLLFLSKTCNFWKPRHYNFKICSLHFIDAIPPFLLCSWEPGSSCDLSGCWSSLLLWHIPPENLVNELLSEFTVFVNVLEMLLFKILCNICFLLQACFLHSSSMN